MSRERLWTIAVCSYVVAACGYVAECCLGTVEGDETEVGRQRRVRQRGEAEG